MVLLTHNFSMNIIKPVLCGKILYREKDKKRWEL